MQASFGRYELVRPLDRGGMGEVWLARARGPERVHKTVVVKRIRAEREADDVARQRFAEEARVAVALSHPHIVPVFEFGELDGNYFLVMEWLRGGNLARVAGIDRSPLSWAATALIGTQLCDALAYVHGRTNKSGARLVHGDLTPRNILFSTDGHALLADFGLARFAGRGRAGTVRYQAPEQARGEAFDARVDLYALALVLSEAATGRPAYDREPERAAKQARVGVIPDLAGCDEELARVLRRALAATPEGRFADAAAMRAAFEALLDRERGARATARAEIVGRCAAATAQGDSGDATRTGATQGTREATMAASPARRGAMAAAAALLAVVVAVAWLARGHDGNARPSAHAAVVTAVPATTAPTTAATTTTVAPTTTAPTTTGPTSTAPTTATATTTPTATLTAPTTATTTTPTPATPTTAPATTTPATTATTATPPTTPTTTTPTTTAPTTTTTPPTAPPTTTTPPTAPPPTASTTTLHAVAPAPKPPAHAHPVARHSDAAPVEPALLDVNATPWAHVRVDGVARGETPLLHLSLPPGTHRIELANEPLGVHRELTVTLQPGEHARRVEDLSR